jgi:hypothetical protein
MGHEEKKRRVSRRTVLGGVRFAPFLFLPAPLHSAALRTSSPCILGEQELPFLFTAYRLTPHYPVKSPVDDLLRYVVPGSDEYVSERYAAEIARLLDQWGQELRSGVRSLNAPANFLAASFKAASLVPHEQEPLRSGNGVDAVRRKFPAEPFLGRERFLEELRTPGPAGTSADSGI